MEPEVNIDISEQDIQEVLQIAEASVLDTQKKDIVHRILSLFLSFFIPVIIMGCIVFSCVNSLNNKKRTELQVLNDNVTVEEAQKKNLEERKTFLYNLKNTLYGDGDFSTAILAGVQRDLDDALKYNVNSLDLKYILTNHFDPFFPLLTHFCNSDDLNSIATDTDEVVIKTATPEYKFALKLYVVRFGLASLTMFCFAAFVMKLSNSKSIMLGLFYSLASLTLIFAQNSSIMSMIIVIPFVMSMIISYIDSPNLKKYALLAVSIALLFASGIYGVIFGIPFIVLFAYIVVCCQGYGFKACVKSTLLPLSVSLVGLGISCPLWIIWVTEYHISSALKEAVISFSARYTFVDFLYKFFALTAINPSYDASKTSIPAGDLSITKIYEQGSLGNNAHDINLFRAPTMYFSLMALVLLVLFFICKKIPARARISAAIIIFLYHLSYAFVPFDIICNIYDMGTVIGMVRFVFLNAILVFLVALVLGTLDDKDEDIKLALFLILGFAILANAVFDGDGASSIKILFNIAIPILFAWVIKNFCKNKFVPYVAVLLTCVEMAFVTGVSFRTSVIAIDYTVNPLFEKEDKRTFESDGISDIKLIGNSSDSSFSYIPYDSLNDESLLSVANTIYFSNYGENLFCPLSLENTYIECLESDGDRFLINESDYGKLIQVITSTSIPTDSRIIIYSQYNEKSHYNIMDMDRNGIIAKSGSENGAFIVDITSEMNEISKIAECIQIEYDIMNNVGSNEFTYGVYYATNENIAKYNALFRNDGQMIDGERKFKVVTNYDYDESVKVAIDLRNYDSYNCCGKLAFDIDSSELSGHCIRIYEDNSLIVYSCCVSIITLAGLSILVNKNRILVKKNKKEVIGDSRNE